MTLLVFMTTFSHDTAATDRIQAMANPISCKPL
jgi:hypothetical protein